MKSLRSRLHPQPLARAARVPSGRRADCLAARTLVSVARQRKGLDPERCQVVFQLMDAATSVHAALHRTLAQHRLSELTFGVLVALFALDPEPIMPADLADYTAVSRAAITDALVRLESLGLVSRTRDATDRRVYHVTLTAQGRSTLDAVLVLYLTAVADLARYVEPAAHPELLAAYHRIQRGAAELHA